MRCPMNSYRYVARIRGYSDPARMLRSRCDKSSLNNIRTRRPIIRNRVFEKISRYEPVIATNYAFASMMLMIR